MSLRVLLLATVLLCVSIGAQVSAEETTTTSPSTATEKSQGGIIGHIICFVRDTILNIIKGFAGIPIKIFEGIAEQIKKVLGGAGHGSTTVAAQPIAVVLTTAAQGAAAATTTAAHGAAAATTKAFNDVAADTTTTAKPIIF
ncbi:uncharacterized protein [Periplaneta americana]|uniref:uncharacterized protein n=1 Tax=Periplaneta americana TaxID=6978 RepID=UPI0037E83189